MKWVRWRKQDEEKTLSLIHCEKKDGKLLCGSNKGATEFRVMWEDWKVPLRDRSLESHCCKKCLNVVRRIPGAYNASQYRSQYRRRR